jgi:lipopolysaccharide/colanic/teichoic acid biosynthesis glycosyltransferase
MHRRDHDRRAPGPADRQPALAAIGFYRAYGKRWLDLGLAALLLALAAPALLAASLAALLLDGRPVFYRQTRIGRHGRPFAIIKFRTMRAGADRINTVTVAGDARITPVGAWLRRTRLDELPQLWHVLRGEMSLVGPRPDVPGYADQLQGADRAILELRPGITGPAALAFANEAALLAQAADPVAYNDQVLWPAKVRINLDYARDLSLLSDLAWLWRTVRTVVGGAAAAGASGQAAGRMAPHGEAAP